MTHDRARLTSLLLLAGCGGQIGEEFPIPCFETASPVEMDAPLASLGFTASDAWSASSGQRAAVVRWVQDGEAGLALDVVDRLGDPMWLSSEPNPDWSGEGSPYCEDAVVLPVRVELTTDDGALAEAWDVDLRVVDLGTATFSLASAWEVAGAGVPSDLQPEDYEDLELLVAGRITRDATDGTVAAYGARAGDAGEELVELASWATP